MPLKNTKTTLVSLRMPTEMARTIALFADTNGTTVAKIITKFLKTGIETMHAAEARRRRQADEEAAARAGLAAARRYMATGEAIPVAKLDAKRSFFDIHASQLAQLEAAPVAQREAIRLAQREANRTFFDYPFDPVKPPS